LKKRRKAERGRAGKRKGLQPRSAATTPKDNALQESEAKFRSLVENTAAPVGITDLTGDFTYVNKALADLTGYTVQELVGHPFMEFLHPEDRERVLKVFMKGVSTSEEAQQIEFRVKRGDGQILTLTSNPTRFEIAGKTVGFQAIITDITERKKREEALRESEQRLRSLYSTMSEGVCLHEIVYDEHGAAVDYRIIDVNPAYESIIGLPRERAVGSLASEIYGTDEPPYLDIYAQVALTGKPTTFETYFPPMKKHFTISVFSPGKGKFATVFADITERKRMQQTLEESEKRFKDVATSSADWIWEVDKDGKYTFASGKVAQILCYTPEELIGKTPFELMPEDEAKRVAEIFRQVASEKKTIIDLENWNLTKNGERICLLTNGVPILDEKGDLLGYRGVDKDITERRRVEKELRVSEEKHRTLFESMAQGVVYQDADGRIFSANPAAERILGLTLNQMQGRTSIDPRWRAIHDDGSDFPGETHPSMFALKTGEEVRNVVMGVFNPKSEQYHWININAVPQFKPGEMKPSKVYTTFDDITERKRMEEELRRYSTNLETLVFERTKKLTESERRFRELADLLPQIVFEIDENGNLRYMNRAAFAATGLSEEDYRRGLNASDMLAPAEHDRAVRGMRRIMGGEMIGEREFTVLRKDGTAFPVIVYTAPIVREGKSTGLRGIAVDITQRRRMEEEMRASKERLDYVITSNPAVIYTGKPFSDYTDFDFTYVSSNITVLLGYDVRDFIDDPKFWSKHVHPDDRQRVAAEIPRVFTEDHLDLEYRFRHKDGTYRWIREENKLIRDKERRPQEVIGYWTDITEHKAMEARLAEARRLATIGEAAAMVGHDLRNPLQAIITGVYLGRKGYESLPPEYAKVAEEYGLVKWLSLVEGEIEYMDKIVSDLQDYAVPLKPDLSQVNIAQLLKDALSKRQIPSNVNLSVHVDEGLQLMIDSDLMKRVFSNLITNAVQAMPKGGELAIDASKSDEEALVSFHDTGVGIPQEDFSKLFSPFFTTKAKGQGLGLPVCKRLVEAHGGEITVESRLGEGTTFTVTLPMKTNLEEVKKK